MARVYKTREMEPARETGRVLPTLGESLNEVMPAKVKKNSKRKPSHKATYKRRDMQAEKS